jgi:sulfide:quinone oxidoreductase
MTRIVILGAGTGGTIMANRLRRRFAGSIHAGRASITVVDQDDEHIYQPGLLFVPFGIYGPEELIRDRQQQLHRDVTYVRGQIEHVATGDNRVYLSDRSTIDYDVLIIASGSRIAPEETEGMLGAGWRTSVFDFYSIEGATALRDKLATWTGGRLVIDVVEMPIKCPVAPLEFAFLADWYFSRRGIRDRVDITYVTPLDGAFTKPIASAELSHLLAEKHINLVTEYSAGRVDGATGVLSSWDDREIPFDVLVTVPLHCGAEFVGRSPGLGDVAGFVLTNPRTLQSVVRENVFAIGDATNVPASKAGSVAHFEADVLVRNIERFLAGHPLVEEFDGHANCFVETGFEKALLIDFNYDVEPLPGMFPLPGVGPLRLLRESRLNHYGKLAFQWIYWHVLLPGHDIPGVGSTMSMRGKNTTPTPPSSASPADIRQHSGAGSPL